MDLRLVLPFPCTVTLWINAFSAANLSVWVWLADHWANRPDLDTPEAPIGKTQSENHGKDIFREYFFLFCSFPLWDNLSSIYEIAWLAIFFSFYQTSRCPSHKIQSHYKNSPFLFFSLQIYTSPKHSAFTWLTLQLPGHHGWNAKGVWAWRIGCIAFSDFP